MPTGILEIKLGKPVQMPARRLAAMLQQARRECCIARNAAVTYWYAWAKANPQWERGEKDPRFCPRDMANRELYHAATAAAPRLSTNLASSCARDVLARLKANTPYDHDGAARWQWQAILAHEVSLPTWRAGKIPAPNRCVSLGYDGAVRKADGVADVARASVSGAAIRFPLLSRKAGCKIMAPVVNLEVGDLSAGRKRILRRLVSGETRLADSQIVERKGKWYVQLCYEVPVGASGLDPKRILTIAPSPADASWPFVATWTDEEGEQRRWWLGRAKPMVAEYRRVVARRRAIRYRYRDGAGSGHGRGRWAKAIKPMSRYVVDMQSRFVKQLAADIIDLAKRERCGSILYREPTMPVRENGWFVKQDVPFNWVDLEARLSFKATVGGFEYDKQRIGMAEWRPKEAVNA